MPNKKIVLIAFSIIIALVVLSFIFFFVFSLIFPAKPPLPLVNNNYPISTQATSTVAVNNTISGNASVLPSFRVIIPNILTVEKCNNLANIQDKGKCLDRLTEYDAVNKSDGVKCLAINDASFRDDCLFRLASKSNKISECRKLGSDGLQEACVNNVSANTKDISGCDFFAKVSNNYQECRDRVQAFLVSGISDVPICQNLKTLEYSSLCLLHATQSLADCDKIVDTATKDKCRSLYLYPVANNQAACEAIPLESYRKVCLIRIKSADFLSVDSDKDGLYDWLEIWINTDPFKADTDNDGVSDYNEYINETSPVDPSSK